MRWQFDNAIDTFSIDIQSYLTKRGLSSTGLTEAVYMVKTASADADSAALATRTLGAGVTIVPSTSEIDKMVVQFSSTNFGTGKLAVNPEGKHYYHGIGLKTSTMAKFLEPPLEDPRLVIFPDFIHD